MESIETASNISDVETCMSYLREMSLYKMMNDPHHRAMLFVLELLMNNVTPLGLVQLGERVFGGDDEDIREICGGGDCEGLRRFLIRYPGFFKLDGDRVSAVDVELDEADLGGSGGGGGRLGDGSSVVNGNGSVVNGGVKLRRPQLDRRVDLTTETEAVKYFQTRLASRQERWMPIRSLAGHLSQAPESVRSAVGPQSQFRQFVLRHPLVFELQGDLVGLRDQFAAICLRGNTAGNGNSQRPRSMLLQRQLPHKAATSTTSSSVVRRGSTVTKQRPLSMIALANTSSGGQQSPDTTTSAPATVATAPASSSPPSSVVSAVHSAADNVPLNSREFQAAMYLRSVIRKRPDHRMGLGHLFMYLAQASATMRDCVGWTRIELEEFVRKLPALFHLEVGGSGGTDSVVVGSRDSTDEVTVLMESSTTAGTGGPGSANGATGLRTVINHTGKVYHVTKLWGILDLGQHEHVFFDKSIFRHLDDLTRHFQVGEGVYFNAILAPKQSRAKWRATQVWKETDKELVQKFCSELVTPLAKAGRNCRRTIQRRRQMDDSDDLDDDDFEDDMVDNDDLYYDEELEYDCDLESCSASLLSEQRQVLDNCRSINEELAQIMQLSKMQSDDEDSQQHGEDVRSLVPPEPTTAAASARVSSSPDCLSSSSGVPPEPVLLPDDKPSSNTGSSRRELRRQRHRKMVSISTQTVSTGDIMSINVFHDSG